MMGIMQTFKIMLLVQLFFSVSITIMTYSMPADSLNFVTSFSDVANRIDLESVSADVQESLNSQTQIPIIEFGALVFYSGNILIDLLLNFVFAIPEMIGLLITGLTRIFSLPSALTAIVQLFASTVVLTLYIIGLMELIASIRSGQSISG